MSYCVNCGVELEKTERACPLCGTEVINPRSPWQPPENSFFSDKHENEPSAISKKNVAAVLCALLMIPIFVVLFCDLIATGGINWSLYVVGGILLMMVWTLLPLFFSRYIAVLFLPLDAVCLALYLLLIEKLSGGNGWFLYLALPLCAVVCVFSLLCVALFHNRKETTLLVRLAAAFFTLGVFVVSIELILNAYLGMPFMLHWSQFVLIPCASLTVAFIIIDSCHGFKDNIRRRIFLK